MIINTVQLIEGGWIVNGHISIPEAASNRHSVILHKWLADGNTPDPADPEPTPPTPQEQFDDEIGRSIALKAIIDQLEVLDPGFSGRAKNQARRP